MFRVGQYVHDVVGDRYLPDIRQDVRSSPVFIERIKGFLAADGRDRRCMRVERIEIRILEQGERANIVDGLGIVGHRDRLCTQGRGQLSYINILECGPVGGEAEAGETAIYQWTDRQVRC